MKIYTTNLENSGLYVKVVTHADHLAEMQRVEAENKVSTALNIADAETIERLNMENAALKAKVERLTKPATYEEFKVMASSSRGIGSLDEFIAARAGGK